MIITQEKVDKRQTVLNIELEDADLDPYLDKGYKRVVQRMNIPGFRKGKAPRSVIENYLGRESLVREVLETMLPECTAHAIKQKNLDAVGTPDIELDDIIPVRFKAVVSLTPFIDLGRYRDIRLIQEDIEIKKDAASERMEQLRLSMASWEPTDRPVELGDMITALIKAEIDGSNFIDETNAVYIVEEKSLRPLPGFSDKLVGTAPDIATQFVLSIPEDFPEPAIAGKEAHFSVTVNEIKKRLLPELDDEFAQSIGEDYETLAALEKAVETSIIEEAQEESKRQYRESVVQALLDCGSVELPPLLVKHEVRHMEEEQQRMLSRANYRMDDYLQSIGKTRDGMHQEFETEAIARLTRTFVLEKIAEEEQLEITEDEVNERINSMVKNAEDRPTTSEQSDRIKASIHRVLQMEKTLDCLTNIASGGDNQTGKQDDNESQALTREHKKTSAIEGDSDDPQA